MTQTTNMSAKETLSALVAASKTFAGFRPADGLQREIVASWKVEGGGPRAVAAAARLRGNLAGFFAGSPRYFNGQLAELRREKIDADIVRRVAEVLAAFAKAAARPIADFDVAGKQHSTMAGMFGWARREQAVRRVAAERAARERQFAARRSTYDFWHGKLAAVRQREAAAA